jgi:hypothetical protein
VLKPTEAERIFWALISFISSEYKFLLVQVNFSSVGSIVQVKSKPFSLVSPCVNDGYSETWQSENEDRIIKMNNRNTFKLLNLYFHPFPEFVSVCLHTFSFYFFSFTFSSANLESQHEAILLHFSSFCTCLFLFMVKMMSVNFQKRILFQKWELLRRERTRVWHVRGGKSRKRMGTVKVTRKRRKIWSSLCLLLLILWKYACLKNILSNFKRLLFTQEVKEGNQVKERNELKTNPYEIFPTNDHQWCS